MQVNLPVNSWPLARRGENARLVVLVVPAVLAALSLSPAWDSQPVLSLANWIAIVMFAMAASLLADEDGQRGTGKLFLAAAGCLVLLTVGDTFRVGPIPAVAWVVGPLVFPILAVVSLRYPDPRLTNRAHRTFVAVEVAHLVVLRTLIGLTSTRESLALPSGAWWPQVVNSPPLNAILRALLDGGGIALTVIFVLLLRRRLRGSFALDRRDLLPVGLGVIATIGAISVDVAQQVVPNVENLQTVLLTIEAVTLTVFPLAFVVAAVRQRVGRSSVADLVIRLSAPGTVEDVRHALRHALCDPSLDIFYWVPDVRCHVTTEGRPVEPDRQSADQLAIQVLTRDGMPLAAVVVDRSLERHAGLLQAALAAAGLALENARLQASVRAQLEEVRASRTRIIEAGVTERRRLERDLHDGAQQRLLALTLTVGAARTQIHDPHQLTLIETIRQELHCTLRELRELAHGIHPAVLTQAGLGPAIAVVAERLPLDVEVDVPPRRWEPAVEATAYFVACEALVNAVKHSAGSLVGVRVTTPGGCLTISIEDDGVGGADTVAGTGLSGLHDRVIALGGALSVTSPVGGGTTIVARLPCA